MKLKCPLLQNMPSKKNQQNYWSFHPSGPFTIAHFNVRHPVVTIIVTVIMTLATFIFYFCLKQQDKHCIRHYDKEIRYKYGP